MSKGTYPWKSPMSIKKAAQRLAKKDGSLNQWISLAVAEKIGVVETAAESQCKRAGSAKGSKLLTFLKKAPANQPEEEDKVRLRPPGFNLLASQ
jgi:hypothetical protein